MQTEIGQFSSHYSPDRSYRHSVRNTVSAILLLILLGAFVVPDAMACHRNNKPHGPNTCDDGGGDGGGSGGPISGEPTLAGFIGPTGIEDDSPRQCNPVQGQVFTDAGTYSCTVSAQDGLHFSTFGMHLQARKRDVDFCRSFFDSGSISNASKITPESYSYGWTDNCTDNGSCRVAVNMRFSGQQIIDATNGQSDALDVQVSTTLTGVQDANPFDVAREWPISQITLQWFKPGTTAVGTVCEWSPQWVEIGQPNSVVFVTEPLP